LFWACRAGLGSAGRASTFSLPSQESAFACFVACFGVLSCSQSCLHYHRWGKCMREACEESGSPGVGAGSRCSRGI
jgi:hypothetical protein